MSADPNVAKVTSGQPCAIKTPCDSRGAWAATIAVSRTAQTALTTTRSQEIRARTSDRHCRRYTSPGAGREVERHDPADRLDAVPHVGQTASARREDLLRNEPDAIVGHREAGCSIARLQERSYPAGMSVFCRVL